MLNRATHISKRLKTFLQTNLKLSESHAKLVCSACHGGNHVVSYTSQLCVSVYESQCLAASSMCRESVPSFSLASKGSSPFSIFLRFLFSSPPFEKLCVCVLSVTACTCVCGWSEGNA